MKNFIDKITFVIVCFNSSNIIKKCIKSINSKAKILIVENSKNYLIKKELEKKFSNVTVVIAGKNLGYGAGNNLGNMNMGRSDISMARGSAFQDDGISIRESNISVPGFEPPQPSARSSRRPDMKGPSDISDILSGLKTKTIDIKPKDIVIEDINNNSTISIDDLQSIQGDANIPKRSRRKPKSDKNTVSLDI